CRKRPRSRSSTSAGRRPGWRGSPRKASGSWSWALARAVRSPARRRERTGRMSPPWITAATPPSASSPTVSPTRGSPPTRGGRSRSDRIDPQGDAAREGVLLVLRPRMETGALHVAKEALDAVCTEVGRASADLERAFHGAEQPARCQALVDVRLAGALQSRFETIVVGEGDHRVHCQPCCRILRVHLSHELLHGGILAPPCGLPERDRPGCLCGAEVRGVDQRPGYGRDHVPEGVPFCPGPADADRC